MLTSAKIALTMCNINMFLWAMLGDFTCQISEQLGQGRNDAWKKLNKYKVNSNLVHCHTSFISSMMKNLGSRKLENLGFSEEKSKNSGFSESRDGPGPTKVLGYFKNKPIFQIIIFWQRNFKIKARLFKPVLLLLLKYHV